MAVAETDKLPHAPSGTTKGAINYRLVSEEIDTILAEVLGMFLVQGSPTKHGGLRFLDVESAKTFGFERTREEGDRNVVKISAPAELNLTKLELANEEKVKKARAEACLRLEEQIRQGPHAPHVITVRPSPDPGKAKKMFVEVQYLIPTSELLADDKVIDYAQHKGITASEAVRRILREHVIPLAKESMDHLIIVVRKDI